MSARNGAADLWRQTAGWLSSSRALNTLLLPLIERKNKERIVQITAAHSRADTALRKAEMRPAAPGLRGTAGPSRFELGAPCGPAHSPSRTHHGCGPSVPRGGSGLGAALRSPHGRSPPVRRAAASPQAPGPAPGRRARGAPGRWEGPPDGRPARAAGGAGSGAATGGAATAPPGASCGSALPAPPAGSDRPAPPTNRSRGRGAWRVRTPPQHASVRHLEGGRGVSQGGGEGARKEVRLAPPLRCCACAPGSSRPAGSGKERGGAELATPPSEGWACRRAARERGGRCLATRWGRRGLGPALSPAPRTVTRLASPRPTFVSSYRISYGSQRLAETSSLIGFRGLRTYKGIERACSCIRGSNKTGEGEN